MTQQIQINDSETKHPKAQKTPQFRVAAVDIDATLLGRDNQISPENAEAIAGLQRQGILVVLASGRSYGNMVPYYRELKLFGPTVSANGAVVHDDRGTVLHSHTLSRDIIRDVTEAGRRAGHSVVYYTTSGNFVEAESPLTEYEQSRSADRINVIPDLLECRADINKIMWLAEPEAIRVELPRQVDRFGESAFVLNTDPEYLEFSPLGVNKAAGLAKVAHCLGVKPHEIVAFGDGNNDVPMFNWVGVGVAMGHGKDSAKEAADLVGPAGDPERALAAAIRLFRNKYLA